MIIAAVILGGVNVLGGEGSLLGTILGVALFAIIKNGLTLMHISSYWGKNRPGRSDGYRHLCRRHPEESREE